MLLDEYKKISQNKACFEYYSELGEQKGGKIFWYQNTNYRYIWSFIENYFTFKEAEGIDRSSWELHPNHHQEIWKQHTRRMLYTRFFSKNKQVYYSTKKGKILELVANTDFNEEEKWIIVLILILDSYFDDIPNYILLKSQEVIEDFLVYCPKEDNINEMLLDFITKAKSKNIKELFKHPYMYFDSFHKVFNGWDFLTYYNNASEEEKEELYNYVIYNHGLYNKLKKKKTLEDKEALKQFNVDILSKKYTSSGNYDKKMIVDNAKVLYIANYINNNTFRDFKDFIISLVSFYATFENINVKKVTNFIFGVDNDIFEICYLNIFNPDFFDNVKINDKISSKQEKEILEKIQETTVVEDIDDLTKISGILKKKALERSNYKCELENHCLCSSHYFTSKKSGKNYLEIHHLIPREFANEFEVTIEQIENYVALCPRCHRFLHYAVDRERIMALNYLFNNRSEKLKLKGIEVKQKDLKKYYKIDD